MACFTSVAGSVIPTTAVNSPADSVVGTAMCGSHERRRVRCGRLGRVDRAATAETHHTVGAVGVERLREVGHRR